MYVFFFYTQIKSKKNIKFEAFFLLLRKKRHIKLYFFGCKEIFCTFALKFE